MSLTISVVDATNISCRAKIKKEYLETRKKLVTPQQHKLVCKQQRKSTINDKRNILL